MLADCAVASGTVDVRALGMTFDQTTQFRIDLTADVSRLRRRLLSLPAVTAVEITPVERAS